VVFRLFKLHIPAVSLNECGVCCEHTNVKRLFLPSADTVLDVSVLPSRKLIAAVSLGMSLR
jgi:hypothetical protein